MKFIIRCLKACLPTKGQLQGLVLIAIGATGMYFTNLENDECPLVHCTPEDTMKDLSVLELEPGQSLTVTNQNGTIVYRKALSK